MLRKGISDLALEFRNSVAEQWRAANEVEYRKPGSTRCSRYVGSGR